MLSRTLWDELYARPTDPTLWKTFRDHYTTPVYSWAVRRLRDRDAADDVTAAVFLKLFHRVTRSRSPRVSPDPAGSYRGYVRAVFLSAYNDYLDDVRRNGHQSGHDLAAIADPAARDELGRDVEEFAGFEPDLDRLGAAFCQAVAKLKAGTQYDPETYRVFLAIYRDGRPGAEVGREVGWDVAGKACKYANRVADRLIDLMGLPPKADRSYDIIHLMLMYHGDPP